MLLLVLGDNFLLMFVGWEGVGLCSYLLIGYYFEKDSAAEAAKKAFLFNRVGDFGVLSAVMLIFLSFGSIEFATVNAEASTRLTEGGTLVTAITLLLFLGATGKSAQIPLFVWLPDAMEGPTPVSALIHAATMVTAGLYMVARLSHLFVLAPFTMNVIAVVGQPRQFWLQPSPLRKLISSGYWLTRLSVNWVTCSWQWESELLAQEFSTS